MLLSVGSRAESDPYGYSCFKSQLSFQCRQLSNGATSLPQQLRGQNGWLGKAPWEEALPSKPPVPFLPQPSSLREQTRTGTLHTQRLVSALFYPLPCHSLGSVLFWDLSEKTLAHTHPQPFYSSKGVQQHSQHGSLLLLAEGCSRHHHTI